MNKKFKEAIRKAGNMLWRSFPMIFGTVLLISLVTTLIPNEFYLKIFTGNFLIDSFLGSLIGSISAGNPIISYILGGEFLEEGISLIAVTAFIIAWVTVGIIQIPAESFLLGKKFTFLRNLLSFIFAIIVAVLTAILLGVL